MAFDLVMGMAESMEFGTHLVKRAGRRGVFDDDDVLQEQQVLRLRGRKVPARLVEIDLLRRTHHYYDGRLGGERTRPKRPAPFRRWYAWSTHEQDVEDRDAVAVGMSALDSRGRRIIYHRFWDEWPLALLGNCLGVSESRASQVVRKLLRRMRRRLECRGYGYASDTRRTGSRFTNSLI